MRITVTSRSGAVDVEATIPEGLTDGVPNGAPDGVTVEGGSISQRDDGVHIVGGSSHVRVGCPEGSDVTIATASGRVVTRGRLGAVHVTTMSGKVDIEAATDVEVRTMSGRVEIGDCSGRCRCVATSGRVHVERAGSAELTSTSGKVEIGAVGDAEVHLMSGRVELGTGRGTAVRVRALSGTVKVTVPTDARPHTTLKSKVGRVRCECPPGDDGVIDVKTMSGTIEVTCRE